MAIHGINCKQTRFQCGLFMLGTTDDDLSEIYRRKEIYLYSLQGAGRFGEGPGVGLMGALGG